MNIRTHGIQALLDIYRMYIGNNPDRFLISKDNKIIWKNVRILLKEVVKREHEYLLNEYFVRNKMEKRPLSETTPEEKDAFFNNVPIIFRGDEKYISPEDPYWEDRYYKALFHMERTPDNLKSICNNYLQGLEWVFKYYTFDCPDWRWKYNYHYPPLFVDLEKYTPKNDFEFFGNTDKNSSFSSYSQLMYVLPGENLNMLPNDVANYIKKNHYELYPDNYNFKWAFCRYFWEAHPILPNISIEILRDIDKKFA
jgi:5'-3' exonuclease